MTYLITQIFILLLLAGLLGLVLGWYLTRISAASQRASLQSRLASAEADVRELRGEIATANAAREDAEAARRQLVDELGAAKADNEKLEKDHGAAAAALREELEACREQVSAGMAVAETAFEGRQATPAGSEPIARVNAAAAQAAAAMTETKVTATGGLDIPADDNADAGAPPLETGGDGRSDDLQQIKGIGPKIASILDEMGIRRFDQIASWSPENVAWVNDRLRFKGRIEREKWIPQAKALLEKRESDS
jgi:predicted flap endonuclease-1-like 5' DNA nuclease